MRRFAAILVAIVVPSLPATAETLTIEASRDATLIEEPDGALANGSGPFLFVGRTGQRENGLRRALLHFDVAGALPHGAVVERAALVLHMVPSNPEPRVVRVHAVLADWGEGASYSEGGKGAPSEPDDATWVQAFHGREFWQHNGGRFLGLESAELQVGDAGPYVWESASLARDVRFWKSSPARNFGWIVIGDETARQTAKSFASRQNPEAALRPVLEVTYRLR